MRNYGTIITMSMIKSLERSGIKDLRELGKSLDADVQEEFGVQEPLPDDITLEVAGPEYHEARDEDD